MFETKEQLIMAINHSLPYPSQITNLRFSDETKAVRFTWRKDNHFRIDLDGKVWEVGDGILIGSDMSILLEELIRVKCVINETSINK